MINILKLFIFTSVLLGHGYGKKAKDEIQNILSNAIHSGTSHKTEAEPLVLPWKKPTTVMEYIDILKFPDDSEIINNHICQCHLEEYQEEVIHHSTEGAI
ncbi:hypothetical protein BBOV_III007065 [Babesia bovis T2Bo]|uniref:hypothetical protein n=1 Tax=Babesia bovis T2Bo TaxID=484906 RepID=UPI001C3690AA|nr:hypothetical protein BBOV_III007065 [Babesia bovis T2Bo]KAG6440021.1 hypothetical protein BBOV_III007065 [Babesia bovis T2Bo]